MYYFASDIHLGAGPDPAAKERRFVRWLDRAAEGAGRDGAIFLLGDVFDFWFEYRRVVPQGFTRTLGRLAELTDRGVRIVFFTGNHDMWVGDYLRRECGLEICTVPEEADLPGGRCLLAHGDNLNIADRPLLRLMNTVFRSRTLRWLFSWLVHPDWAMRFGHWWSGRSRKGHADEAREASTEILVDYARRYRAAHPGVERYLFGHMHCARDVREEGLRVVLLGAWDDGAEYAVLHDDGRLELKNDESL